jgi:aspartyl-tRNA(Asn)/glutamyl-tRNA(Gln) amidotransferase subunit C
MNVEISSQLLAHLAHLSRLEFEADELPQLQADLNRILGFIDALSAIDTTGVEPLVHLSDRKYHLSPASPEQPRQDVVRDELVLSHEEALLNAPQRDSDYFRVPKVLSGKK